MSIEICDTVWIGKLKKNKLKYRNNNLLIQAVLLRYLANNNGLTWLLVCHMTINVFLVNYNQPVYYMFLYKLMQESDMTINNMCNVNSSICKNTSHAQSCFTRLINNWFFSQFRINKWEQILNWLTFILNQFKTSSKEKSEIDS